MTPPDATTPDVALLHYAGRAGDHNDRAMVGSRELTAALSDRLGVTPTDVGSPAPALSVGWAQEIGVATPTLRSMAERLDEAVVWFDAHGDLNTPTDTTTDFLGGMALSGPLGLWDSGFGAGVDPRNAILVGARDLDPAEQELVDAGTVALVGPGPSLPGGLRAAVAGRPVFVHVDCDVLEPGTVPTDYQVPDGLTLDDLREAFAVLAESEVVGLEVGELESAPDGNDPPSYVTDLLAALEPLLPGRPTA